MFKPIRSYTTKYLCQTGRKNENANEAHHTLEVKQKKGKTVCSRGDSFIDLFTK